MTAMVRELFQQFGPTRAKRLKRLTNPCCLSHRAKAPVLMRILWSSVKYAVEAVPLAQRGPQHPAKAS